MHIHLLSCDVDLLIILFQIWTLHMFSCLHIVVCIMLYVYIFFNFGILFTADLSIKFSVRIIFFKYLIKYLNVMRKLTTINRSAIIIIKIVWGLLKWRGMYGEYVHLSMVCVSQKFVERKKCIYCVTKSNTTHV